MNRSSAALGLVSLLAVTVWAFTDDQGRTAGAVNQRADPSTVYNPVLAGERLPDGFRQLLPRDGIKPVYDPSFVNAAGVGWRDDTQVIGVSMGGESKAYPVSFLNGREMVVDEIDGIPILVTW